MSDVKRDVKRDIDEGYWTQQLQVNQSQQSLWAMLSAILTMTSDIELSSCKSFDFNKVYEHRKM